MDVNHRYMALPDITLEMAQQQRCHCNHPTTHYLNNNIKKQEYGLTAHTPEPFSNDHKICYKNGLILVMVASIAYLIFRNKKK